MKVLVHFNWPVGFWNAPESQVELLRKRFPAVTFTYTSREQDAAVAVGEADVIFASRLQAALVEQAIRLRWVQSPASSVSTLPLSLLASRGVVVTNTRSVQGSAIAEHVMGGILVLSRRFDRTLAAQRERRWIQNELMKDVWPWALSGKAMTILGLGAIGQEVARRAHVFGMKVTGVRRQPKAPAPAFVTRVFGPNQLDDALQGCDVLVIAAPSIASTDQIITAGHIARLNRGAILVNVARGSIVDQDAVIAALQKSQLGGAILDVFNHEPLDPSSALWTLPNVVITPHIAGLRPDHWDDVIELFTDNLRRFERGDPLLNTVDLIEGY